MKDNRVFWHIMFWNASIKSCLNSLLISRPIDRPLNAGWFPAQRLLSDQSVINQRSMYGGGKKRVFHCPVVCCFGNAIYQWFNPREKVSWLFDNPWDGKVCLPQRPEVSSEQATALPLPNGLRQPLFLHLLFSVRRFAFFG